MKGKTRLRRRRYSPEQLFDVVADVGHYCEFVPWCQRSVVVASRPPDYIEAELEVGFKLFVERCAAVAPTLRRHLTEAWQAGCRM